jgi:hypothetical protein
LLVVIVVIIFGDHSGGNGRTSESINSESSFYSVLSLLSNESLAGNQGIVPDWLLDDFNSYLWIDGNTRAKWGETPQGAFQVWIETPVSSFPPPGSMLNCWELVIVLLVLKGALTRAQVLARFTNRKTGDEDIIQSLLGIGTPIDEFKSNMHPGDILAFQLEGVMLAHVVVVIHCDEESTKVLSFWNKPNEKPCVIKLQSLLEAKRWDCVHISEKFRDWRRGE